MIELVFIVVLVVVFLFGFVLLYGAPYLPTLHTQVTAALELADLKKDQHMLELGCGDGKVMIAALQSGAYVTGYELNPILAAIAWVRTRRYGKRATVVFGNFWTTPLPASDVIFVFLLPKYMAKLDKKITQEISNPVKLVSFAFKIQNKDVAAEKSGLFLYTYTPQ